MEIILLVVISVLSVAQVDIVVFDEDDITGSGFYDASWGFTSGGSTLTMAGSGDKLKIDTDHFYAGNNSGLLQWKSVSGGNWHIFVSSPAWQTRNAGTYDTLVFYLNSRTAISSANLPYIALESDNNVSTPKRTIGTYIPAGLDADSTTWQRIPIPITSFAPYGSFNLSQFKDVNFSQNTADNTSYTLWFDDVRLVQKIDTVYPAQPHGLVSRSGDSSVVLHWDSNSETELAGYNIYRSTSLNGSYSKQNTSIVDLLSYADVNVGNGTPYYYCLKAINVFGFESPASDTISVTPHTFASDDEFLDYVQQTATDFFWYEASPTTGLIRDRNQTGVASSIASVGFGLTAICNAVDHGWLSRSEARDRTLVTLKTFWEKPQGSASSGTSGYKGFFYHFLDMNTGLRAWSSELSSIDTGLLLAGILDAKQYYTGSDTVEKQIRTLADSIFNRVDWNWMRNSGSSLTMGWFPESGFIGARWIGYNEAMILYFMGLGSPTYAFPLNYWSSWTSGYSWQTHYGYSFVNFPPLFGHQYSHCWVDFRNIQDSYMRTKGITYAENTRRATLAQRAYCIANPGSFAGYGSNIWGLTACDGPSGYAARGGPPAQNDDGTIAPTAAGGSLPFAPEVCIPALREMYSKYRAKIWTGYGFRDAFNIGSDWWGPDVIGIDEGPIAIMIENYRTQKVWNRFMQNPVIQTGLVRAGFAQPTGFTFSDKWNLVSVPKLVSDYRKSTLFSTAISPAYSFQDGYTVKETLSTGAGFWLKFNGGQIVQLSGIDIALDTIDVVTGWNLIGSISTSVAVTNINSIPGGIVTSNFFGYNNGYTPSDSIQPAKGYWVKVSQNGKLILSSTTLTSENRIRIENTDELPPAPPEHSSNVTPRTFALEQNYPNPFNPTTTIHYELPVESYVSLKVYNQLGEVIASLVDEKNSAGVYNVQWNAANYSSGVYYYQLRSELGVLTRNLVLIK